VWLGGYGDAELVLRPKPYILSFEAGPVNRNGCRLANVICFAVVMLQWTESETHVRAPFQYKAILLTTSGTRDAMTNDLWKLMHMVLISVLSHEVATTCRYKAEYIR
jgi:hypothetical protein